MQIDRTFAEERIAMDSVGDDVFIFDDISKVPLFDYPTKMNVAIAALCLSGTVGVTVNLREHVFSAPYLTIILPEQILQYSRRVSEDFSALFVVMSKPFIESLLLNPQESLPVFFYLQDSPGAALTPGESELLLTYYSLLRTTIRAESNAYTKEVVRNLVRAFFYGIVAIFRRHEPPKNLQKRRKEVIFEQFSQLLREHCRERRSVSFFAAKLCLTPKYLSSTVKEISQKTAGQWIDESLILEAKVMLKSSGRSIQQISDDLSFPNQSFFGKYFKQHVGVSPREYRKLKAES
ncbi:MAG: helix-turn-helix domain-containing protein [Prevotellaceae bacterium]|jgi:AraC-like DNA-binding protein|nr:helix-turn-helix domain-containing protein [Prevotellaceae bacterium]